MDSETKATVLREVLRKFGSGAKIEPAEFQQFTAAQNDDLRTGPEPGQIAPDFELADHNGKRWSPQTLAGPQGLLLVFSRSADW